MFVRFMPFCLIAIGLPAYSQVMFEGASGFGGEGLNGKPKSVTLERETLPQATILIEEESVYREDGKLSTHKRFSAGKPSTTETFEYDRDGNRSAVRTRNAEGNVMRTQTFRRLPDDTEEEIDLAGEKQSSRTIRRFDDHQRVVESKTSHDGEASEVMRFEYDDRGRPVEARIRIDGPNVFSVKHRPDGTRQISPQSSSDEMMRVSISYLGENKAVINIFAEGKLVSSYETTEDAAGNQIGQVLYEQDPQNKPAGSVRIEKSDEQGNWTLQTLLGRDPRTQADVPVARMHRTIVYY